MSSRLRPRRQRKADPVAGAAGVDAHQQQPRPRRDAQLGASARALSRSRASSSSIRAPDPAAAAHEAAARLSGTMRTPYSRPIRAQRLAALAARRRPSSAARTRLQLHDLGVAELAREQRRAVLPEEQDRRRQRDRDHGEQQQREAPEQRARQQRHGGAVAPPRPHVGCRRASSGTNT